MPKQQKKIMPIDYTHREFETIREDLMGIAERFYPDRVDDCGSHHWSPGSDSHTGVLGLQQQGEVH